MLGDQHPSALRAIEGGSLLGETNMGNVPTTGIQILTDTFRVSVGTLASDTSLSINSTFGGGLSRAFLIKQMRYWLGWVNATDTQNLVIGFCNGGMSAAEITSALSAGIANPDDASNWDALAQSAGILWETVRFLHKEVGGGMMQLSETISIGGRKGIPANEAAGIQLFVFNPNASALTTGSTITGGYNMIGVWLRG